MNLKHGEGKGIKKTAEYMAWCGMLQHCYNQRNSEYLRYGARGITVCDGWRSDYLSFLSDVGRRPSVDHSVDRINNNLGYAPDNVRWATRKEQGRNKRNSRTITALGETKTLAEWVEVTGISRDAIKGRLKSGWPTDLALSKTSQRGVAHAA